MTAQKTIIMTDAGSCSYEVEHLRGRLVRITIDRTRQYVILAVCESGYIPALAYREARGATLEVLGYSTKRSSNAVFVARSAAIDLAEKYGLKYVE